MKIAEDYKLFRRKHSKYFKEYTPDERIKHSSDIINLKTKIDTIESKIISGVLNFTIDYKTIYNKLSEYGIHHFLDKDIAINRFEANQKIALGAGYNANTRSEIISDFKDLCNKVWEDLIITIEERSELNEFCRENQIDRTQQYIIEQEISRKYTDGIDLDKVIKDYFVKENLKEEIIQKILLKEYKKDVPLKKIKSISSELSHNIIINIDGVNESKSELIKTINYDDIITIYLIKINGTITSRFDFEIGFEPGTEKAKALKVMISEKTYSNSDRTRLVDILSDALCYNLCVSENNLTKFLDTKVYVREQIDKLY